MLRRFLRWILRVIFNLFTRVEVIGLETVPKKGGLIIAVNHLSYVDAPLVFALIDRPDLTAMVADKYLKNPLFRLLVNIVNGIWINRETADLAALREARDYLKNGGALGIAPEGTRSQTGQLQEAKTGVAFLAEKAGVPMMPTAISGSDTAFRKLVRFQRPRLTVIFGDPVYVPRTDKHNRAEILQRSTDELMCRIAALLPPAYRGVYSGRRCMPGASSPLEPGGLPLETIETSPESHDTPNT